MSKTRQEVLSHFVVTMPFKDRVRDRERDVYMLEKKSNQ